MRHPFGSREAVVANVFISHTGADIAGRGRSMGGCLKTSTTCFSTSISMTGSRSGWGGSGFSLSGSARPMRWCATCSRCGAPRKSAPPARWPPNAGARQAEPIDDRLLRLQQSVDAAADPTDARDRLRSRLCAIDGAGGWGWPDDKFPYPGLRPFDLGDHRVLFGRSRHITRIADRLRSINRTSRVHFPLVVLSTKRGKTQTVARKQSLCCKLPIAGLSRTARR